MPSVRDFVHEYRNIVAQQIRNTYLNTMIFGIIETLAFGNAFTFNCDRRSKSVNVSRQLPKERSNQRGVIGYVSTRGCIFQSSYLVAKGIVNGSNPVCDIRSKISQVGENYKSKN